MDDSDALSSTRWKVGEYVERCDVFSVHEGERQRSDGAADAEAQLRHHNVPVHHQGNENKLLRQELLQ